MSTAQHDVIVVGGGLVGAVAALGLARSGREVLLVDRARPAPSVGRFGVDIRNIACSPGSRSLLEAVGVWSALDAVPYRQMQVWEEQGTAALSFAATEAGREELGWIVENSPAVMMLWAALAAEPLVEIVLGELTGIEAQPDRITIALGQTRHCGRLLLGVDGARSAVRSLVEVAIQTQPTGQHAIATVVRTEIGHEGVAFQRFLLDGPVALLPSRVPDCSSVVWSQSPDQAALRLAASDAEFSGALGTAIEHRLGRIVEVDQRLSFPLQQHVVADFNPWDRVLLIGDAARVLHPLAGLGANVGFEDVRDLLAGMASLPAGADPGTPGIWRVFARRRRVRARLMVAAMAGFRSVYADDDPMRQWLRNSAVGWVNEARPLKRQIIREALGLGPLASTW